MVSKLLKHEMNAFARSMLPMEIILVGMALLTRFVQLFETATSAYYTVRTSSIVMFVIAIVVCLVMTIVVSIRRFYVNLFSSEGYLSFTLPVTAEQHIFAKLLISAASLIITVVTIIFSCCIATAGDVLVEVCKAVSYVLGEYYELLGGHMIAYIFEAITAVLIMFISQYLLFYACISIGQLFHKKRVLAAFGAYFAYYIFTQILGTVLIIVVAAEPNWLINLLSTIGAWAELHTFAFVHIVIIGIAVFYAVLSVVFFAVSRYIIKNRLNLE